VFGPVPETTYVSKNKIVVEIAVVEYGSNTAMMAEPHTRGIPGVTGHW